MLQFLHVLPNVTRCCYRLPTDYLLNLNKRAVTRKRGRDRERQKERRLAKVAQTRRK